MCYNKKVNNKNGGDILKKVAFYTLGCKTNQYETNGMIQLFKCSGYEIVDFEDFADIYIVNTCTVTSISDKKSRMFLRKAKKINPNSIVVACGCYVQVAKSEVEKIPEIDLCIGTNEKANIVKYIEEYIKSNISNINISDVFKEKEFCEFGAVTYTEKTRAVVKVQDGCDRFCTYCLIPYARGRVRSRKPENIIEEVKNIAKNGYKEIVITGIHIASYGKDFEEDYKLINLLEDLDKIEGIKRIRLGSIEPLIMSEEFCERLLKLDSICHHFHLSLQSGCDETLSRMNRRYSISEFKTIVDRLRRMYSDCILTTDIIVGFPGETDEEFEKTYEFLKEVNFYKMHIFKYSPRKGTKAASMPNQIDGVKKEERSNRLLELSDKNELNFQKQYLEKEVDVLFEEKVNDFFKGHTANYIMVNVKFDEDIIDQIKTVKLTDIKDNEMYGEIK